MSLGIFTDRTIAEEKEKKREEKQEEKIRKEEENAQKIYEATAIEQDHKAEAIEKEQEVKEEKEHDEKVKEQWNHFKGKFEASLCVLDLIVFRK